MRIADLSQPIAEPMSFYPTDPVPQIATWPSTPPWRVSELHLGSHSGTHLDAPSHYGFPETVSDIPLERCVGRGLVIDVMGKGPEDMIDVADVGTTRPQLENGAWAIFRTGWDRHWGTDAYLDHPSLSPELARRLIDWRVELVGVDMLNPDSTRRGEAIIHDILLGGGTIIVENLTGLEQLEAGRIYMFSMLPLKLTGLDGAPVRAVAWDTTEKEREG